MKRLLIFMSLFVTVAGLFAQGFPTISTDENTQWYLIQFMNGGNALTAKADGQITTSAVTGEGSQQWKITGDETDGYTFTTKKGLVLYVDAAEKENMVKSSPNIKERDLLTNKLKSWHVLMLEKQVINLWGNLLLQANQV